MDAASAIDPMTNCTRSNVQLGQVLQKSPARMASMVTAIGLTTASHSRFSG